MKTLASLVIALSLALSLSADPKCERLAFYDMANLKASFEKDLVSNIWRTNLLGSLSTLYFQDDGLVIVIPAALQKVQTYMWSVEVADGRALLAFFGPSTAKEFMIAPTCSGISATGQGKSTSLLVSAETQMSEAQQDFLRAQLLGFWHYRIEKSRKAYPAQFSLSLLNDGTFRMKTGPDHYHSTYDGVWQMSTDGQYLILYTRVLIGQKEHYVPESISLKSVDFEDMVIDAKSLPRALEAYRGKDQLYLSKARA